MRWLFLGLALLGCGESTRTGRNVEAETHWMRLCEADAECGDLSCVCGVCTAECPGDACPTGGVCAPGEWSGAVCGAARFCTAECAGDATCESLDPGLACIDGFCAPRPAGPRDGGVDDPDGATADPDGGAEDAAVDPDRGVDGAPPDAGAPADVGGDPDAGDPCDGVECEECRVCEAGECVPDAAQLALDAPVCGDLCADWPNRCTAILAFHDVVREGRCYDPGQRALCEDTTGVWDLGCESVGCGMAPGDCVDACTYACDCGRDARWDPALGCVGSPECSPGTCVAEATCAGAWRDGDACRDPSGLRLDGACCADVACGPAGTYREPAGGTCVEAQPGCGVPVGAPPCDPADPPCDVGLFLRYPAAGARGGGCFGGEGEALRRLSVSPEVRVYRDAPQRLEWESRCPAGPVIIEGLPPGYDEYGTCMDGACDEPAPNQTREVADRWRARAVLGDDARACNDPLPVGAYQLGARLPLVSAQTVCDFAWLELHILGE